MVVGNAQLFLGAGHRIGIHAANLGALEAGQHLPRLVPIVDVRPFLGISHLDRATAQRLHRSLAFIFEQVGGARQHNVLALAVVQAGQYQAVGVGVVHHLVDGSHHDRLRVPFDAGNLGLVPFVLIQLGHGQTNVMDLLHLQPSHGQAVSQVFERDGDVDEIFKPGDGDFHNCS